MNILEMLRVLNAHLECFVERREFCPVPEVPDAVWDEKRITDEKFWLKRDAMYQDDEDNEGGVQC